MRCINKRLRRLAPAMAVLLCVMFLFGCSRDAEPENAFRADQAGLGVELSEERIDIPWFAEDLCVADGDVEAIEADTSASLGACFFDLDSREVLYAKNIYGQMYPASTTKLMTALVAFRYGNLEDVATVSEEAITFNESRVTVAKLAKGDTLTIRQLLYALLVMSANDAANVIAEHVGGSIEQFVVMMNEEAAKIGATNSHFTNPNGLQDEEHYTTVYDLYLIFQEVMQYEEFMEILKTPSYETTYTSADGKTKKAAWESSNQFTKQAVEIPEGITAVGGKTGTTSAAKSCLVQLFEDSSGKQYVAIILGCEERAILYEEMRSFLTGLSN